MDKRHYLIILAFLLGGCSSSGVTRTVGVLGGGALGGALVEGFASDMDVKACEADRGFKPTVGGRTSLGETYCETALKRARCWNGEPDYQPPWYDRNVPGQARPFCEKFGEAPKPVEHKPLG